MEREDRLSELQKEYEALLRDMEVARSARNKGRLLKDRLLAEQRDLMCQKGFSSEKVQLWQELQVVEKQAEKAQEAKRKAIHRLDQAKQEYNRILDQADNDCNGKRTTVLMLEPEMEPRETRTCGNTKGNRKHSIKGFEPVGSMKDLSARPVRSKQAINDNNHQGEGSKRSLRSLMLQPSTANDERQRNSQKRNHNLQQKHPPKALISNEAAVSTLCEQIDSASQHAALFQFMTACYRGDGASQDKKM